MNQIATFKCLLKSKAGYVISNTVNRDISMNSTGSGALFLLAAALQNLTAGEKRQVSLAAIDAYGFHDPQKVVSVPRKHLSKHVRVGETVTRPDETGQDCTYQIMNMQGHMASLDPNHILAGQDLEFNIEVISVREALPDDANKMKLAAVQFKF